MIIEQFENNENLTNSEKQIIDFIEKKPREVVDLSLEELSQKCYVSQASVIRLCKKLGTKGFADFKIKLASELNSFILDNRQIHVDIPINENSNCENIAEIFYNLSHQTLETTFNNLDYTSIKKAAQLLSKADIVHLYGRGESLILAEDLHYKLVRIGVESSLETLNGFQEAHSIQNNSKINKVALVISQYCNSRQFHYVVDSLISNHIPFILLTAAQKAWPYDNFAAVTIRITCSESRFKMGSFASRNAMLYVLDCLYGQLFALNYDKNIKNLTQFAQKKIERSYFYDSDDIFKNYD